MTDRELMQQALEALEKTTANTISQAARIQEAITALRERLEQPEQEPVGYFQYSMHLDAWVQNKEEIKGIAFYTSPPQRKPLTDEEIGTVLGFGEYTTASTKATLLHMARALERSHDIGEKK